MSTNKTVRFFIGLGLLVVVAALDNITGPEISFSIFYLIPVTFLAWHNGIRGGLLMALLAAITWHTTSALGGMQYRSPFVPYWNSGVRLGFFALTAALLSLLRQIYEGQEALVAQRTASLSEEITHRAAIEQTLRHSRERFRDLVENINDVFYLCDANGTITYAAPNLYTASGYNEHEVLGHDCFNFAAQSYRPRLRLHFLRCARNNTRDTLYEFPVLLKDGSEKWAEQATRIIRDEAGVVVEYRNVLRDITTRRKAEEHIRMLADALESTSEMISITDLSNRFVYLNRAFLEKYGYSIQEILGQSPAILASEGTPTSVTDTILTATNEDGWRGELMNQRKDGTLFPIYLSTSVIKKSDGSKLGYIGVAEDISEKKQAEEAVERAEAKLRSLFDLETGFIAAAEVVLASKVSSGQALHGTLANRITFVLDKMQEINKNMLVFASLASHELRTPLAVIRHQLEIGLSEKTNFHALREINLSVYDEVLRMRQLVDDFLSFARLSAGTFSLKMERVGFHDLLNEFYQEASLLAREKNITIVLELMPKAFLMLDVVRIRQVLFNLLSNSLRSTPERGRIYLGYRLEDARLVLTFSDTGTGVSEEMMEKIFEPFYQGRMEEEQREGVGIGLALVKGIVEAHHGSVRAGARDPQGLTFTLTFPLPSSSE
jgi:PAS domain S-box-containing protein